MYDQKDAYYKTRKTKMQPILVAVNVKLTLSFLRSELIE